MSVSRSLAWMGFAQGLSLLLQFGVQIVLARYLTLHDAGIYAVALAMLGALSLIQNLGLQSLIVREETLTRELAATIATVQALIALGVAGAVYGISFASAAFLSDAGVGQVLAVLAVTPLISAVSFLPLAMIEREGRFKQIALIGTVGSIAGAIVTIVTALLGARYMSAAYGQIANAGIVSATLILVARRHFRLSVSFAGWRRVAGFGLNLLAIGGINALGLRLSDILMPRFLGLSALGLYSRAAGLNGLMWGNVQMMVGRVMLVDFVALHRAGTSLRTSYIAAVDNMTALLWPVFAGFAVVSGPFIYHALGAKWLGAAVPLMLLCAASMVSLAIAMTWEVFTARDELATQAKIEFRRAIVALTLFVVGCSISLEAAAASRVLEALFAVWLYRPHLNRMTNSRTADFWPVYGRNLALTLIAVGPAALVMTLYRWDPQVPLPALTVGVIAGASAWALALMVIRHPMMLLALRRTTWTRRREQLH